MCRQTEKVKGEKKIKNVYLKKKETPYNPNVLIDV